MFRNIIKRTYKTIKSNNDEQANQALLGRLKHVPLMNEKKVVIKSNHVQKDKPDRHITKDKLTKLIKLHTSDPLTWNSYILSRIFKLPHDTCENVVNYTKPFAAYTHRSLDKAKKLVKNPVVIDIERMKRDETYLIAYKKLAFVEGGTYQRRALE